MRQLYLDCDGVLADFDRGATAILGMKPKAFEHRHGLGRFWQKLAQAPDFYFSLPLLADAMQLFDALGLFAAGSVVCGARFRLASPTPASDGAPD